MSYLPNSNLVSTANSTATLLNAAAVFTGTAEDVSQFDSVIVAVKTDQDGTYTVQFSNDGTNWDSVLTRYYRTSNINPPHRFTITRKYVRVEFTNTSASNQTYLRLQTTYGQKTELNAPMGTTLAQDYDAVVTRPTDYRYEVALGLRQGRETWNKFGYNADIDVGTETIWSVGGLFDKMETARTLSVVSTDTADTSAGTGARTVTITGIDANYVKQIVTVTMNGTTPVVTAETWFGVNRMSVATAGTGGTNAGAITATATTDATTQAQIPIGVSTSQQAFFFVQDNHKVLMDWLYITLVKNGGGTQPILTTKCFVTDLTTGVVTEIFRDYINGSVENHSELIPSQPFIVGEKSLIEFRGTTDVTNTEVAVRFSFIEFSNFDA